MRHPALICSRYAAGRHLVRYRVLWCLILGFGVTLVAGCASDSLKPPPLDEGALYWRLTMNHHAVTLSMAPTYDTLTLDATPRNVHGEVLAGFPAPTYQSTDVATVRVSADGVLQAVAANSQPVWVFATVTAGNLRHVDSALVRVVDMATPPVLASFSVHPLPPDSAKTFSEFVEGTTVFPLRHSVLPVRANDPDGTPFDSLVPGGIPVYFRSSDTIIARVGPITGEVTGLIPGDVTLYASTTAFGVSKVDTLPYRIGWQVWNSVGASTTGFSPSEVTIGAGGIINWRLLIDTDTIDVTFSSTDVPAIGAADAWPLGHLVNVFGFDLAGLCAIFPQFGCASAGNIDALTPAMGSLRTFPIPGTYEYRSTRYGVAGRVIVVDER